jgi:hypothetical protein
MLRAREGTVKLLTISRWQGTIYGTLASAEIFGLVYDEHPLDFLVITRDGITNARRDVRVFTAGEYRSTLLARTAALAYFDRAVGRFS